VQIFRNRTEIEQEVTLKTDSIGAISSDSESELEEDSVIVGENNKMSGS
jgi:hypothetical protein